MGSPEAVLAAVYVLEYVAPVASFVYFALASTWSICALQTLDSPVRKKLRSFVLSITGLIILSCVS